MTQVIMNMPTGQQTSLALVETANGWWDLLIFEDLKNEPPIKHQYNTWAAAIEAARDWYNRWESWGGVEDTKATAKASGWTD